MVGGADANPTAAAAATETAIAVRRGDRDALRIEAYCQHRRYGLFVDAGSHIM
jgi:hypothetical protein